MEKIQIGKRKEDGGSSGLILKYFLDLKKCGHTQGLKSLF